MEYVDTLGCSNIGAIVRRRLKELKKSLPALYDTALESCGEDFPDFHSVARALRGERKLRVEVVHALIWALDGLCPRAEGAARLIWQLRREVDAHEVNRLGRETAPRGVPRRTFSGSLLQPNQLRTALRAFFDGLGLNEISRGLPSPPDCPRTSAKSP